MNRFSPKQTLSNFATAVRETVDSVNKKTLATALVLATPILMGPILFTTANAGALVAAAPQPVRLTTTTAVPAVAAAPVYPPYPMYPPPQTEAEKQAAFDAKLKLINTYCTKGPNFKELECALARANAGISNDRSERMCERLVSEIGELGSKAKTACGQAGFGGNFTRCFDTINACEKAEEEVSMTNEEDEGGAAPYCNKILANSCPAIPSLNLNRDFKDERKDAERERKEAKKEVDELMQEEREQKLELAKKQLEITEAQQNEAVNARKSERELGDKFKEALEGLSDSQKKGFESAQEAFAQMEVEYIKMRKEARDSADLVAQAKDDLQVMCRASAEKKYQDAEKVRLAALAARKKNLGAGTNVSGAAKRTKAATARARLIDYTAYFSECVNGSSADGVGGNNRIKTAERAKASADKLLEEKAGLIEKQRDQMFEKLKAMEADATNQKSKIVEEMNEKLKDMNEDRALVAQQNAARIAQFQSEQALKMQSTQQLLQSANEELMKTQKEAFLAESRLGCAGRSAERSESRRDKVEMGFADGVDAIKSVNSSCLQLTSCGLDEKTTPSVCKDAATAINMVDPKNDKLKRRPKTFDTVK